MLVHGADLVPGLDRLKDPVIDDPTVELVNAVQAELRPHVLVIDVLRQFVPSPHGAEMRVELPVEELVQAGQIGGNHFWRLLETGVRDDL